MVFSISLNALRSWNWRFSANLEFRVSESPLLGGLIELARQIARSLARSAERANLPTGQTSSRQESDRAVNMSTRRDARILGHVFRDFPTSGDSRTSVRCGVRRSCDARFSPWLSRADQITRRITFRFIYCLLPIWKKADSACYFPDNERATRTGDKNRRQGRATRTGDKDRRQARTTGATWHNGRRETRTEEGI